MEGEHQEAIQLVGERIHQVDSQDIHHRGSQATPNNPVDILGLEGQVQDTLGDQVLEHRYELTFGLKCRDFCQIIFYNAT